MKKFLAVLAVLIFVGLPLIHLIRGSFEEDWSILPASRSKKTVEITEISDDTFTQGMIQGQWVLYLYYPNITKSLELMIDEKGNVTNEPEGLGDAAVVTLGESGDLEMQSGSLNLKGPMDKTRERLEGMAIVRDASSPIPFSCFKIGTFQAGK